MLCSRSDAHQLLLHCSLEQETSNIAPVYLNETLMLVEEAAYPAVSPTGKTVSHVMGDIQ